MDNNRRVTTDHDEIKEWAQKLNGIPERIDDITTSNDEVGIRIDFPRGEDDMFFANDKFPREVSWEEFFQIFEEQELAFIYTLVPSDNPSYDYKFIKRSSLGVSQAL